MPTRWSILILTMPHRRHLLEKLLANLQQQALPEVEILVKENPYDLSRLGANRQALLEKARGEYVNFIDDDDEVPADYLATIFPLLDGVDYIGFQIEMTYDGRPFQLADHSLKHKTPEMGKKNVSHLNPIRRELAMQGIFEGGFAEDRRWAERVAPSVKTEHYIPRVMYVYHYSSTKNVAHG